MQAERIAIGRIVAPQGIKGEVRVLPLTDFPERFLALKRAFLAAPWDREVEVEGVRFHKGMVLLKIRGVDTRNEAEELRNADLRVEAEDLVPLGEGQYYVFQIIGLEVFTEDGQALGRIADVLRTGSNDVYVVRGQREYLIPAVKEFVAGIDLRAKTIVIRPIPGLLD